MMRARFALAAAVLAVGSPAAAADLPADSPLPSLAADPETQAPNWKGLYVGTELAVASFKGVKGASVGGDVLAGYDREFDNHVVLGVQFSTGYSPWIFPGGAHRGFDFAETSVKVGYDMGRLTPYVMTGVALARPTNSIGGPPNLNDSVNGVFGGPGALQALGTAGVGLDYAVTNNLHVGVEASVINGNGPFGVGVLNH
jgi:opacity protein-like surface antigen